jgi:acyl-coenzyme A thioesterase PaaI-like protein
MAERPIQDFVEPFGRTCWGCGQQNAHGFRIRSFWRGEEAVCTWRPEPHHNAAPGVLNGGVIATLMDCHCACVAISAAYRAEGREMGSHPAIVMVTGSLHVDYLRPTPMDGAVELRARVKEITARKAVLTCALLAGGIETARGEVVMVRARPA